MTQFNPAPFSTGAIQNLTKSLVVAYDFSDAANTALKYAVMMSRRFGTYLRLITVQTPAEYTRTLEAGPYEVTMSRRDVQSELHCLRMRLFEEGIQSDAVRRIGNASDVLWEAALELKPDLLFFGAFGQSQRHRLQLGSTAEHLLRTLRCPAFIVGPHAVVREPEAPPIRRILCATTSLHSDDNVVLFAGQFAAQMEARVELLHPVGSSHRNLPTHLYEQRCQEWSHKLRQQGISVSWTVLYGSPEAVISARAKEVKASLVLFGLHRRGKDMVDSPDGVVSAAIRQTHCPIMTVPADLPLQNA